MTQQPQSTAKKDLLLQIEKYAQAKWEKHKPYEVDCPPTAEEAATCSKYFITFPYPYMNGMLHLGHGFSLSKSEFAARFWRLKGRRVLWPFGLHVTGTPIAACAQKIANEIKKYGCPPQFPEDMVDEKEAAKKKAELQQAQQENAATGGAHHSRKAKLGPTKPQWLIMKGMGLKDEDIAKFEDAGHWLQHFPALALEDLKRMGCHIDYRRSFITTDVNPFYNRFIEWQFRNLRAKGCLHFGKRYSVYSPYDGQPCQDHDRASGEGVLPQEYTVVKVKIQTPLETEAFKPFASIIGDKDVILPGATLRPETVVGQTNCWVSPNVSYKAFEITAPGCAPQIYVMTAKAARNMAFQDFAVNGKTNTEVEPLFEISGEKLIGLPLSAPFAPYATIYALPMFTITENKGTGVVMSVPSDSPDDWINLKQLMDKPDYRKKLNLKDEWVLPFPVVPIIDVGGDMGCDAARVAIESLKVQGPKDAEKLEEAKKLVYSTGFYQGVMILGPFKGEKVAKAKVMMAEKMLADKVAITYQEPMKEVISRSGDACIVAKCDQWYIEYGKTEWKKAVHEHIQKMEFFHSGILNGFTETLEWLSEWPCSRTFGLGTHLPFADSKGELIDSLSDSTIYMSYYSVAKFVHSSKDGCSLNLDGTKENAYGLKPEMFTDDTFDFIFRAKGTAEEIQSKTGIPAEIATQIRNEFNFWYPVDLRVSGKDLIQNHLTMFLYNHAAIWDQDTKKWPRAIYCNGHVQVDGEKMSKSKGNFITLRDALEQFTPDAMRLAIADAGDSLDDANFVRETANGFIMKLASVVDFYKERVSKMDSYRTGPYNLFDKIFDNAMNRMLAEAERHYSRMTFRGALNTVFFELAHEESKWVMACGVNGLHQALVQRYLELFPILLSPLAPHTCEYLWGEILKKESLVVTEKFPQATQPIVFHLFLQNRMISDLISETRVQAQKNAKKKVNVIAAHVYATDQYLDWQQQGLTALLKIYKANNDSFPKDTIKQIQAQKEPWLTSGNMQDILAFIAFQRDNTEKYGEEALALQATTNDMTVLNEAIAHIQGQSGVAKVIIHPREDESIAAHQAVRVKARPGQPSVNLECEGGKK